MTPRATRSLIAVAVVAVLVGAGVGLYALWNAAKSSLTADTCTISSYQLDPDQAAVASTMVGAVTTYRVKLPERATVLVLAAALQESKLRNLAPGEGDRDSVGVLQQRPSQGWGGVNYSIAERTQRLTDVGEATREFVDALIKVPHWQILPLAEAVQDVQISADGSLYAQHEPEAKAIADALQGIKPAAISCSFARPTKVASTATVATQAGKQLGIDTPAPDGQRVLVPGARWQTVAWFVANADRLGIERVAYDGREWSRSGGWAKSPAASAAAVTATMYQIKS